MGMKDWIYFNSAMINRHHITFVRKLNDKLIIELGGIHYSFNKMFENVTDFEREYEDICEKLGIN